jgi:signal transduction histidine kinase
VTITTRARAFLALGLVLAVIGLASTRDLGAAPYVVPPLVFTSIVLLAWNPIAGGGLLVAATVLGGLLGVTPEHAAVLPAWLPVLYVVGRRADRIPGGLVLAAALLVMWLLDPTVANLAFGGVLLGGSWGFGRLVQARARKARQAASEHATLAAEDHNAVVRDVVAVERARVTADAISIITAAVTDMRRRAVAARGGLDQAEVSAIASRGAAAVAELRRMLGLLREEPTVPLVSDPPRDGAAAWRGDLLTAGLVALLTLTDPLWTGAWELRLGDLLLCLPLALRRSEPALALITAAGVHAALLTVGVSPLMGFGSIAELVLLSWTAGTAVSPTVWAAGAAFGSIALTHWWSANPDNLPVGVVWVAGSAWVGWVWRDRDREYAQAHAAALALRRERQSAVEDAVLAERLRIARELHDVTSHAVGVMVTQAGAAEALAHIDPDAARAALDVVDSAGSRALVELALLTQVLDVPRTTPRALVEELEELAARIRATGSPVEMHLDDLPTNPTVEAAVYRLVQEALTNVVRHAHGALVEVAVRRDDGNLSVQVRNTASPSVVGQGKDTASDGSGFGLVGLAERVRALGGHFKAGPADGGGFVVQAVLPCRVAEGIA